VGEALAVNFHLSLLEECERRLFRDDQSTDTLYHYTAIPAFMNIVRSRTLQMSDIRYMNDASEISYGMNLIEEVETSVHAGKLGQKFESPAAILTEVMVRLGGTYVGCFSQHGSRLSQWRGYCDRSQGISIGFRPDALRRAAETQQFAVGKCLYNVDEQKAVVWTILEAVGFAAGPDDPDASVIELEPAVEWGPDDERDRNLMGCLPRLVALLKNPHFDEESEWRMVSHLSLIDNERDIQYRAGKTMIIPYWRFKLPERPDGSLDIDHIWIGPTAHPTLAEQSMTRFLENHNAVPTGGLSYCGIPLREL
jgi:hypothetical protein